MAAIVVIWRGRAWRSRRLRCGGTEVALLLGLCGACLAAAGGHRAIDDAGPVRDLAAQRATVSVTLRVEVDPMPLDSTFPGSEGRVFIRARVVEVAGRGEQAATRTPVLVIAPEGWSELTWRDTVEARGRFAPTEGGREAAVFSPSTPPMVTGRAGGVFKGADHARSRLRQAIDPVFADARGLVPGLVIGDTSLNPPGLADAMRDTGLTHLSAVSGSNVAMVLGAVVLLARLVGLPRHARFVTCLVALGMFVILCRPEPSVIRAGTMGAVGLLGVASSRRSQTMPALGAAIGGLLLWDPWLARSYGFALSSLATLGIVLFARPWATAWARQLPSWMRPLAFAVSVPLAAQLMCGPVLVLLQDEVSVIAVGVNVIVAPFVAPATLFGVATTLVAIVCVPCALPLAWAAALPAQVIGEVARPASHLPWRGVPWPQGGTGAAVLAVLTVAAVTVVPAWWAQSRRRAVTVVGVLAACVAAAWPMPPKGWPPPAWSVAMCDVGQGDASVLSTGPGRGVLVDAGPESSGVVGCLKGLGVGRLDAVVVTHFHDDHMGGVNEVLAAFPVGEVVVTGLPEPAFAAQQVVDAARSHGVPVRVATTGEPLPWPGVEGRVVYAAPPRPLASTGAPDTHRANRSASAEGEGSRANDASIVLDATARGVRVLLTGDLEAHGAARVRRALAADPTSSDGEFDVVKVAHHGSAVQDGDLVRTLAAPVGLIGVGEDNTYGHPAPRTLDLLRDAGTQVWRTDWHGDIAVYRDDGRLIVTSERDGE